MHEHHEEEMTPSALSYQLRDTIGATRSKLTLAVEDVTAVVTNSCPAALRSVIVETGLSPDDTRAIGVRVVDLKTLSGFIAAFRIKSRI